MAQYELEVVESTPEPLDNAINLALKLWDEWDGTLGDMVTADRNPNKAIRAAITEELPEELRTEEILSCISMGAMRLSFATYAHYAIPAREVFDKALRELSMPHQSVHEVRGELVAEFNGRGFYDSTFRLAQLAVTGKLD